MQKETEREGEGGGNTQTRAVESLEWLCLKHNYPETQLAPWSDPTADKLTLIRVRTLSCLTPQAGALSQERPVLEDLLHSPVESIYLLLPNCSELCGRLG